jgi:hypothetical protein
MQEKIQAKGGGVHKVSRGDILVSQQVYGVKVIKPEYIAPMVTGHFDAGGGRHSCFDCHFNGLTKMKWTMKGRVEMTHDRCELCFGGSLFTEANTLRAYALEKDYK